jgi:predicted XRE-type DNA-binding protein
MKSRISVVRGHGNVFREFNHANAHVEQVRALLAARIIKNLDSTGLTARAAHEITGIASADFSRIRKAKLDRFTIDRLLKILARLEPELCVGVTFRPKRDRPQGPKRTAARAAA